MSWVRTTRRAAAYGGGGIVGVSAGMVGVLAIEARLARRFIGPPENDPPHADGWWDADGRCDEPVITDAPPVRLAMLGDSSAAGLGAHAAEHTPAAVLAQSIARLTGRPVFVRSTAVVGAQSSDLDRQVDELADLAIDVAIILVGANDVTHRVPAGQSAAFLGAAIARLRAVDTEVVIGSCPDLGTVRPIPHPLRMVCRYSSRFLAHRQTQAAVDGGARAVSMGHVLGPEFTANPHELFSPDRFHPSTAGYAAVARALLPATLEALGEIDPTTDPTAVTSLV